jgi:arginase family enzyme
MHAIPGQVPFVPSGVAELVVTAALPPPAPSSPPAAPAPEVPEAHLTASARPARAPAHGREGRRSGPVIAAPTSAGDPRAPGLRRGPPYVMAQFDPAEYVLHRPRLGDGTIEQVTAAVSLAAASAAARGEVPVVVGGDHTVALGGVTGVREGLRRRARRRPVPPLFLLWLDAHPDLNTAETTPTGHLHGMVLAGLLGFGPLAVPDPLPTERVTLAGVRSIDAGEAAYLKRHPELVTWNVKRLRDESWGRPLESLI